MRPSNPLTAKDEREIVRLYTDDHLSIANIADYKHIGRQRVRERLVTQAIPIRGKNGAATKAARDPELWRKGAIANLYANGIGARAIAAIYNIDECDVPHIAAAFERAQWQRAGLADVLSVQDEDEVDARAVNGR